MNKLIIPTNQLQTALKKVGQAVNPKSVIRATQNLLCRVTEKQLELIGTNTELTIYYRLGCETNESFDFLLPFELITKIAAINKNRSLEFEIGNQVVIKAPGDTYKIKLKEKVADFPKLQELPKKSTFDINNDILSTLDTALHTTKIGDERFMYVMMELSAGKITIASTDGAYMVFTKEFEFPGEREVEGLLLSPKLIKALEGCEGVTVCYHAKAIGFESEDLTVVTTRTNEKYVDFRKVFPPDWPPVLKINKDVLTDSLGKCSLSSDALHTTKIGLGKKESVSLFASDSQIKIDLTIPAENNASIPEVVINSEKMLKLLQQLECDDISFAIHDANRAIVLTTDQDATYRGMLMPIANTK